ncbi:peroxidase 55 [Citrus sinensis]|uniref:peroxidase 55-like n=1 Tax=Citrus sinensis TaxID=2711 RepID=UPI000763AA9A|nr:peroxidase 55-like [Citrus sinensis]XP_024046540.1 peroxidase 55-like [Citrus x clementina]KAH9743447.1 peroxidase 55 [Citrus sinensis]
MINQKEAERLAEENLSLPPFCFDILIKRNQAVEAACPGIVSCAHKLAIAARDAVVLANGPSFNVELGCRDGLNSDRSHVPENIPDPPFDLTQLNPNFARKNLKQFNIIASQEHRLWAYLIAPTLNSVLNNTLRTFSSSTVKQVNHNKCCISFVNDRDLQHW